MQAQRPSKSLQGTHRQPLTALIFPGDMKRSGEKQKTGEALNPAGLL
jgi:hypothetical protein